MVKFSLKTKTHITFMQRWLADIQEIEETGKLSVFSELLGIFMTMSNKPSTGDCTKQLRFKVRNDVALPAEKLAIKIHIAAV